MRDCKRVCEGPARRRARAAAEGPNFLYPGTFERHVDRRRSLWRGPYFCSTVGGGERVSRPLTHCGESRSGWQRVACRAPRGARGGRGAKPAIPSSWEQGYGRATAHALRRSYERYPGTPRSVPRGASRIEPPARMETRIAACAGARGCHGRLVIDFGRLVRLGIQHVPEPHAEEDAERLAHVGKVARA